MRRVVSLLFASMFSLMALPEQRMTIHSSVSGDAVYSVFNCKDIILENNTIRLESKDAASTDLMPALKIQEVDSLTFADPISKAHVQILYAGDTVEVVNPYAGKGVEVKVSGANVEIVSTTDKYITYYLKGTSLDGSLAITPSVKFALFMDGLVLANMSGPAIRIMEDYRANIILADCSKNALVGLGDGVDYNAAFWSRTQLVFTQEVDENGDAVEGGDNGTGHLGVSSMSGHGIYSKDYVRVKAGELQLTDVAGDGINTKDYFRLDGGSVTIKAKGDAVDCNDNIYVYGGELNIESESEGVKALKCDTVIDILGGEVNITMSGKGSRALKNDFGDITIKDAKMKVVMTGGALVKDGETDYTTAIKSDQSVKILDGSDVDITCGPNTVGGKGINATVGIQISNANLVVEVDGTKDYDAESGGKVAGLKTDGDIMISNSKVVIVAANLEESGVKAVNCSNKNEIDGAYEAKTTR